MTIPKLLKDMFQLALIFGVVFWGNRLFQTHLGEQAIAKLDLPTLTYAQALQQATAEDKLIIAEFSAVWCGSCRKFHEQVLMDETVKTRLSEDYVFTRLEYESEDRALFTQYGVTGFPTVLMLDANGRAVKSLPLTFDPVQFVTRVSSAHASLGLAD